MNMVMRRMGLGLAALVQPVAFLPKQSAAGFRMRNARDSESRRHRDSDPSLVRYLIVLVSSPKQRNSYLTPDRIGFSPAIRFPASDPAERPTIPGDRSANTSHSFIPIDRYDPKLRINCHDRN